MIMINIFNTILIKKKKKNPLKFKMVTLCLTVFINVD